MSIMRSAERALKGSVTKPETQKEHWPSQPLVSSVPSYADEWKQKLGIGLVLTKHVSRSTT